MKMGIIGLPSSGKSTIFGILSGEMGAGAVTSHDKPRISTVKVPDDRVDWLSAYYKPQKTTFSDVEFVDFAAIRSSKRPGETFSPQFLATLRTMEGILMTVRLFDDEAVYHPDGSIDALRDISFIDAEFLLADLAVIEAKVDRLAKNVKRGLKDDQKELELLERVKSHLEAEQPMRTFKMTEQEEAALRGYAFLSGKPTVILLNLDEEQFQKADEYAEKVKEIAANRPVLPLSAQIEEEIAQLDREDQLAFLSDLGQTEPARDRLIKQCFELLGLIVFFTVGEDEVRAWTLRNGLPAVKAAGCIHSDLEKGFIRAEVFAFEDLKRLKDVPTVKKEGLWRLEGKEYVVRDGDVICIRHNM